MSIIVNRSHNVLSALAARFGIPVVLLCVALGLPCSVATADQTSRVHRIGVLPLASPKLEEEFRQALKDVGLVEGRNIAIDWWRFEITDTNLGTFPPELRQSQHDVLVALGTQLTRVAVTSKLAPVVFVVGDPVRAGFAASLSKPGGTATGISVVTTDLDAKRMELLKQLAPKARRIGFLRNPGSAIAGPKYLDDAAQALGLELVRLNAKNKEELEAALRVVGEKKIDALLVGGDLLLLQNKGKIAHAARQARLPAVFPWADYHDEGALASYAPNLALAMRRAATYVDSILKGANPGELPIEQLSTYELTVDLRLARAMNIEIPEELLLRANRVIR